MAESKIHPPSESRVAEARRAGVLPRPIALGLCASLVVLAAYVPLFGARLRGAFVALFSQPLEAFARAEPQRAWALAWPQLTTIAQHLLICALTVWSAIALLSWLAQGPHFSLPHTRGRRFSEPRPSRTIPLLWAVVASVLFLVLLRDTLWLDGARSSDWLARWLAHAALGLVLLAIIDISLARAAFFRALFMTRREQREELREAYGSPETRAARDRVRRELGQGS